MSSIIEQIANGDHDEVLDDLSDAIKVRQNHLNPDYWMEELGGVRRLIGQAYMQSAEKKARLGIEAVRELRHIKEKAAHIDLVIGYANLLYERALVECLNFTREHARIAVAGGTLTPSTGSGTLVVIDNSGSVTPEVQEVMHTEVRRLASEGASLVVVDGNNVVPTSAESWRDIGRGGFQIGAAVAYVQALDPNPYNRVIVLTDDDSGQVYGWPTNFQRLVIPTQSVTA